MAIQIITDSTADLSSEQAQALGIQVIPLGVRFGEQEFIDGVTITKAEFYARLEEVEELPQTSQICPHAFEEAFAAARAKGDEVVALVLSSELSGTYQSALIAQEQLGTTGIFVVDSRNVTMGLHVLALQAAALAQTCQSAAEVAAALKRLRERVRLLAVVDTLKYLEMGGRLSGATAKVGTVLGVKPVIQVTDGKVAVAHISRSRKAGTRWMLEQYSRCPAHRGQAVVGHTGAPELMQELIRQAQDTVDLSQAGQVEIGAVVGVHAGPGCYGMAWIAPEN